MTEQAEENEKEATKRSYRTRLKKTSINCLFCDRKHKLPIPETEEIVRYCNCGSAMFLGFDPEYIPFVSKEKRYELEKEHKVKKEQITDTMFLIQFYPFTMNELKEWFTEKEIETLFNKLNGKNLENKESGRVHRMRKRVEKMMDIVNRQEQVKLLYDILFYKFKAKDLNGVKYDIKTNKPVMEQKAE